jgi:hypothetical protein
MNVNIIQYLIKIFKHPKNTMDDPMTLANWWDKVNSDFLLYLGNYVRHGTDPQLHEDYHIALGRHPQIQNVVETYRHEQIEHIPRMGQQVWNELGHGDWISRDVALDFCIQYMIDNTMRVARAFPRPQRLGPPPTVPDTLPTGPTGVRFKTHRLRIR